MAFSSFLGNYINPKPADDCWYRVHDLRPPPKTEAFLSPAALEAAGLTGKEKFHNVTARLYRLFFFGSSLRTLRALREKMSFSFCSSIRNCGGPPDPESEARLMLFARHALASRPQAGLCPGKRMAKVKGGQADKSIDFLLRAMLRGMKRGGEGLWESRRGYPAGI